MLGEGIVKNIIGSTLERMRELESVKNPMVVHGYSTLKVAQIGERAKHGVPVVESYGSTRSIPGFEDLFFLPAMIDKLPIDPKSVMTATIIGKRCKRPLQLSTPIMLSGMAYGLSVTEKVKICWGKASSMADTACNSGDAGFFPDERKYAKKYIVQYNRARYGNSDEDVKNADAIEIRFGQGAMGGYAETVDDADMNEDLAKQLNVEKHQGIGRPFQHPEMQRGGTLKDIVQKVRKINPDVPVGVKIAAGNLEADLDHIIDADCDFVTIDGAGGGTASSPEVTLDNLGIPLVYAIPKAHRYLKKKKARDRIDIIATGGLRDAGDFLKVMALGADAIYTGESALIAMAYSQLHKVPPGTSPAEMYLSWGKHTDKLDIEEATLAVVNFIKASTSEMAILTGMLGKDDLKKVDTGDMISLSESISKGTGVKTVF